MVGGISPIGSYSSSIPYLFGVYRYATAVRGASRSAAVGGAAEVTASKGASGAASARTAAIPAAQPETPVQAVRPVPAVSDSVLDRTDLLRRLETDPAAMAVRSRIRYLDGENAQAVGNRSTFPTTSAQPTGAGQLFPMTAAQAAGNGPTQEMPPVQTAGNGQVPQRTAQANENGWIPQGMVPENNGTMPIHMPQTAGKNGKEEEIDPTTGEHKSAQEVVEESECQTCAKRKYQDGSDDPGVSFKTPSHVSPEMAASAVRGHENEHVVRERAKATMEDRKVVSQSVTYHTAICPECGKVYVSGGETRTVTAGNVEELYKEPEEEKEPTVSGSFFGAE